MATEPPPVQPSVTTYLPCNRSVAHPGDVADMVDGVTIPYPAPPMPPLQTIGYEAARFDQVRDALLTAGTRLLIDVRAIAASRRPGFSKRLLAGGLADAGIDYLHLQPLGTPKDGRDAVRRGDVGTMQRIFRAHMEGDRSQAALQEARAAAFERPTCLLCFERDPAHCHRTLVAGMIAGEPGLTGQTIHHLHAVIDLPEPTRKTRPVSRTAASAHAAPGKTTP